MSAEVAIEFVKTNCGNGIVVAVEGGAEGYDKSISMGSSCVEFTLDSSSKASGIDAYQCLKCSSICRQEAASEPGPASSAFISAWYPLSPVMAIKASVLITIQSSVLQASASDILSCPSDEVSWINSFGIKAPLLLTMGSPAASQSRTSAKSSRGLLRVEYEVM